MKCSNFSKNDLDQQLFYCKPVSLMDLMLVFVLYERHFSNQKRRQETICKPRIPRLKNIH